MADDVLRNWEKIKAQEKQDRGILAGVPRAMPALARAQRIGEKVQRVGFDWSDAKGSFAKVKEEVVEIERAIEQGNQDAIGRKSWATSTSRLVNLSRHVKIDAEGCLRAEEGDRQVHAALRACGGAGEEENHGGWGEPMAETSRTFRWKRPRYRTGKKPKPRQRQSGRTRIGAGHGNLSRSRGTSSRSGPPEMTRLKERSFHGKQVFRWIHQRGVTDAAAMTDLPASLRTKLAEDGLGSVLTVVTERRAADDTRKLLVALSDGASVETVLIPRRKMPKRDDEDADRGGCRRRGRRRGGARGADGQALARGHPVHFDAGWLRDGMRVLRERRRRAEAAHASRRDRGAGPRRPLAARRRRAHPQRRADGHGRAAPQLRRDRPRAAAHDAQEGHLRSRRGK